MTSIPRMPAIRCLVLLLAAMVMLCVSTLAAAQIEASALDPERPWAAEGDRLLAAGEYQAAENTYMQLSAEHGLDSGLWTRIAWARLQQRQLAGAIEASVRATELDPQDMDAILMRAQCEALAGDAKAAAATLQKGLDIRPGDQALMESLAATFIALERWPEAAGLLRELIRMNPDEASYYMDLGRILLTGGEYGEAVAAFGQARIQGADGAQALAMTGKAHLAAGQWAQARSEFEQSIAIHPTADAYGGLATIQYLEGDPEAALAGFRRAVQLAPRDADLQFNLANILIQNGEAESAERAYRTSLQLDPGSAEAHLNLAILLLNRFEIAEAEQHLRVATQADPELPGPWLHLARIAGARFEFDVSRRNYERYRELVQDSDEQTRIDQVLLELDSQVQESQAAVARGEVHLLQARVGDQATATEMIDRAGRGEDFFLLASEYSDLGERGAVDAGFMDPAAASDAFRAEISSLDVGQMTAPIAVGELWFVFMRVE